VTPSNTSSNHPTLTVLCLQHKEIVKKMDRLSNLARFKNSCPFLHRTKSTTLRRLSTTPSSASPAVSRLTYKATKCPVMGPALAIRSYASVAERKEVDEIHKKEGVYPVATGTGVMCPHAAAGAAAAKQAEVLAKAKATPHKDAAAGCPFPHAVGAKDTTAKETAKDHETSFDYAQFYVNELDKKHQDKSYRYFNNINRLAAKFPVAHTSALDEEVAVWCSNDYLGMSKNPVVLETMQYVRAFDLEFRYSTDVALLQPDSQSLRSGCRWNPQHSGQRGPSPVPRV
jgi:5-aminolevulinate synthase